MNYQYFQHLFQQSQFDGIKIIGKDIKQGNRQAHILGMALKEKKVFLYVLELDEEAYCDEGCSLEDRIPRNSMKRHMEEQAKESIFMRIREFQNGGKTWPVAGATSGSLKNSDCGETYFMFFRMMEAGWKLSEKSPFYDREWDSFIMTSVELEGEFDTLPEWKDDMQVLAYAAQESGIIEQKVLLECGRTNQLEFSMTDGTAVHCYINKVFVMDMWEEQEKRFADPEYRAKILVHISEKEFEEMKKNFFEALEQQCPKGECYIAFYYECDQELNLQFYDREYLDTVPQLSEGNCSSMFISLKPEEKEGMHGLPLKGTVIQKAVAKDAAGIEAELFSYSKKLEQKIYQM